VISTQSASTGLLLSTLPPAIGNQISSHPQTNILQAIMSGRKFESGAMELESGLENFKNEPACISELNNFHAHFHGGCYRSGWIFQLSGASLEKTHLSTHLELLARRAQSEPVDVRYALGGFSYRYLAESPNELWQQVDATVTAVTGQTPERFGEMYRDSEAALAKARHRQDFLQDSSFKGAASFADARSAPHLDPQTVRLELALAEKHWAENIEPQVMRVYRSLMSKGYATKDFWT
jgi:hypothetical protein